MSADLNRLMDNLRIRLPGAVDDTIKLELFNVLKEFFDRSNCWYNDIEFAVTSGVKEYTITPLDLASPLRLIGVVDNNELALRAFYALPDQLTLDRAPNEDATYTARIALTVNDPVTREGYPDFPDWVLDKYMDGLIDGVLGRMMSQIAKPYTNERMGIYHMRRFRNVMAQAKVEAQHENVYRGQNWRFPQTFARRRAR